MPWTRFMDMCSGGSHKEDFSYALIEAPREEAKIIFFQRFGHNPERVTCTCCGDDYVIDESETLAEATAYDRGLRWVSGDHGGGRYLEPGEPAPEGMAEKLGRWREGEGSTVAEFLSDPVRFGYVIIRADEIRDGERVGEVPKQGYVWVD